MRGMERGGRGRGGGGGGEGAYLPDLTRRLKRIRKIILLDLIVTTKSRGGDPSDQGNAFMMVQHPLVDEPPDVLHTLLRVPARRELVRVPREVDVERRDERCRGRRGHQVEEPAPKPTLRTCARGEGGREGMDVRVVPRDGVRERRCVL